MFCLLSIVFFFLILRLFSESSVCPLSIRKILNRKNKNGGRPWGGAPTFKVASLRLLEASSFCYLLRVPLLARFEFSVSKLLLIIFVCSMDAFLIHEAASKKVGWRYEYE